MRIANHRQRDVLRSALIRLRGLTNGPDAAQHLLGYNAEPLTERQQAYVRFYILEPLKALSDELDGIHEIPPSMRFR